MCVNLLTGSVKRKKNSVKKKKERVQKKYLKNQNATEK
jgi:hypothetical protein